MAGIRRGSMWLVFVLGCSRRATTTGDGPLIGPEPAAPSVSASASQLSPAVPSAPPHVVALPACTPSPRLAWSKSPTSGVSCSPALVLGETTTTLALAPGTPLRLHLRAKDTTTKGPFRGHYVALGLPKGAKLDASSGELSWTTSATTSTVELGFAAVVDGDGGLPDCVTDALTIRVVDDERSRADLFRWQHYLALRDADLATIPSDDWIEQSFFDGESWEGAAARRLADKKAARLAEQAYRDSLLCGRLPGGSLADDRDVDADGQADAVFSLLRGHDSFVVLRTKAGDTVVGKVFGQPVEWTADGRAFFLDEDFAENQHRARISWIDGGLVRSLVLDSDGSSSVEWEHGPTGVTGVVMVTGTHREVHAWTGDGFVAK